MKLRSGWLLVALLMTPAYAGDVFEHPQTPAQTQAVLRATMPDLGQIQVLRGQFKQRKFLHEIPRPLSSSGEFLLVRDRGIWWHTQTPLDSALTLTPNALLLQDAGSKAQSRSSKQQPGLDLAATLFFALFTLDLDTLAHSFELFVTTSGPHWVLGLQPHDAALSMWFQRATISGDQRVQQVTLYETTGDRTEIDLDAAATPLASLTAEERQRFAH